MTAPTLAFLGTGSMNGSIASGLIASGYDTSRVRATVRSEQSAKQLAGKLGDRGGQVQIFCAETDSDANLRAVTGASVVLLGVKPHGIVELVQSIADSLAPDTLLISVAAGVPLQALQSVVGQGQPVIRCMPNTPSRVGKGVLAISAGETITEEQLQLAEEILGVVGRVVRVEEEQMDSVTALAGSGPAYAFLLAETMADAGVRLGLDRQLAVELAAETVAGAGALLDEDPNPENLRRAVTSPGGTTEQAILTYQEGNLGDLTFRAMKAASDRSAQMSRDYRL